MALAIISLISLLVGIIWKVVLWANSRTHKISVIRAQMKQWERNEAYALSHDDAPGINVARAELKRLREEARVFNQQ